MSEPTCRDLVDGGLDWATGTLERELSERVERVLALITEHSAHDTDAVQASGDCAVSLANAIHRLLDGEES